ncbi:MAG TPA: arginase [Candidatus Kapabacteria bacterium]|jgi:arginase|nr:arginase [Ignavibacteria bacterium]HRE58820.1 arginase [Candidatus Kapabacteria bacterium]HRK59338.1 arginase [Candidatus Kapabacteria bacterium]
MNRKLKVIGYPLDLGAGRRGVDMGPSALRIAGLAQKLEQLEYEVHDIGDITVPTPETQDIYDARLRYLPEITKASEALALHVKNALDTGFFPLILGGDHSMSIGSVAGISAHCKAHNKRLGVIWVDAHSDINTPETTPSGNIHGMPVAVNLGIGAKELTGVGGDFVKLQPQNITMIGLRSVDPGERELIKQLGIEAYSMTEIDKLGMYAIMLTVLERMKSRIDHLHISFDLDGVDPSVAKGVGTPVSGGLSYRETHLIMEMAAESGLVKSFEVTEVNPILDDMNQSADFAVGVVTSCLGKRIL